MPCATTSEVLMKNDFKLLKEMVAWKKQITKDWQSLKIVGVAVDNHAKAIKDHKLDISVTVNVAGHNPDELKVEILHGPINTYDEFKVRHVTVLDRFRHVESNGDFVYSGEIPLLYSGLYGYAVRITPYAPYLPVSDSYELMLRG